MLALIDPPNRATFTDGAPRRLTYAQAERAVAAIAGAAAPAWGCRPTPSSAFNCPTQSKACSTILGVMRAGMIAAPLPLLWRRADAVAALGRIGAKALITCGRVGRL